MSEPLTIGVRDSGVGGLTVAHCIKAKIPDARLLYFADTAHVPYGERTPEEVRHYAISISRFLIEQGAGALVFACNTSSALALDLARETFDIPIFGTIEPGARAATKHSRSNRIGVLATRATVESGVYSAHLKKLNAEVFALEEACPEFVPLVENEETCSAAAVEAARRHLAPLQSAQCDTVVLGCTHYPLLLPVLRQAAPEICFIDPAQTLAEEIAAKLGAAPNSDAHRKAELEAEGRILPDRFWASGESESLSRWIAQLLAPARVERGPIYDLE